MAGLRQYSRSRRWGASGVALVLFAGVITVGAAPAGASAGEATTARVSVASDGTQGTGASFQPSISGNGRYVAFTSEAPNLVAGDTNRISGGNDVFVRDNETGSTVRVSVSSGGTEADAASASPTISADGTVVAFVSSATNLVPDDTNRTEDVFVHDRLAQTTTRVSVASDGTQGDRRSYQPSISGDGRYVAFTSEARNLVPGDTNHVVNGNVNTTGADVFVHDRQSGTTTRTSVSSAGVQGAGESSQPAISGDGRYVAFTSDAGNLVTDDISGGNHIFVHDRQTATTTRVSVASDGSEGNGGSRGPVISADGRVVAFTSFASNLVAGDTNSREDVFAHDRQTGTTTRVSVASDGTQATTSPGAPAISGDGGNVAFPTASPLVADDTNGKSDLYVHDRQTGATTRASVAQDGAQADDSSPRGAINGDGTHVAFDSLASNLVPGDTNNTYDVFVRSPTPEPSVISVADVAVVEGDTGSRPATFTVSLSRPSASPVTLSWATVDASAVTPSDYTASTGTLSFPAGATTRTIDVAVHGDGDFEGHESFTLTLSEASGAILGNAVAVGAILDDDPIVSVGDVSVAEGDDGTRAAVFSITLSKPSPSPVTVDYATGDGTATGGEDYTAKAGTLTFSPGATAMAVKVAVTGDKVDEESSESFTLSLTGATAATIGDGTGVGTIVDDDPATVTGRRLAVGDVAVHEGDAGGRVAVFNVSLSKASTSYVTVSFATAKASAVGADFVGKWGTVRFAPGTTSANVKVAITPDDLPEGDESFTLKLSGASGATITDATGVGTIVDDD